MGILGHNSLLIDRQDESYLFKHGFFDENILEGVYPLFGDDFTAMYENTEIDINFKGIINNEVVVSENYRVGADCCHIYFVEGNRDIIID